MNCWRLELLVSPSWAAAEVVAVAGTLLVVVEGSAVSEALVFSPQLSCSILPLCYSYSGGAAAGAAAAEEKPEEKEEEEEAEIGGGIDMFGGGDAGGGGDY